MVRTAAASSLLIVLLLLWPAPSAANMRAPWDPGDPAGEPLGELSSLVVQQERLELDLRPLAGPEGSAALVKVTYRFKNGGYNKIVPLVFVTPGIEEGEVTLDGVALPGVRTEKAELPAAYREGLNTPDIDGGGDTLELQILRTQPVLRFLAPMKQDALHELQVRYKLRAPVFHEGDQIHRSHLVGYLLSPARTWGGFEKLEVEVNLPAGWEAASSPALTREGDRLSGTFKGIPADLLGITVRKPAEVSWGWVLMAVGFLAGLILTPLLAARAGRWSAARTGGWATLAFVGALAPGIALVLLLPVGGLMLWRSLLDDNQISEILFASYNYFFAMFWVMLGPLIALLMVCVAFFRARRL